MPGISGPEDLGQDSVVTLFWSRMRPDMSSDDRSEYDQDLLSLRQAAEENPGFVFSKTYTAPDGERMSVVVFRSPEAHAAWARLPAHRAIQAKSRSRYYTDYQIAIGGIRARWHWEVADGPADPKPEQTRTSSSSEVA